MTVPKLFVNNSSGKIGLVGYWDCIAFDEFVGKQKRVDKALVDIMKNYMANKSFSRGVETLGAEASMVFVGNTQHTVPYMLKHNDLFDELPDKVYDSAFLDRIHFYIPGWEVDIIRGEMFSNGYGFVVDYLAEILRALRNYDYADRYQSLFTLSSEISTRDRDGIHKTFSGLMKILFPYGEATEAEIEELLGFAIEGRKRVKDQLMRIDSTYARVNFGYEDRSGHKKSVKTLEEIEYPQYYYKTAIEEDESQGEYAESVDRSNTLAEAVLSGTVGSVNFQSSLGQDKGVLVQSTVMRPQTSDVPAAEVQLQETHLTFQENQKGVTFDTLFAPYLKGASLIIVTDPYIRLYYQIRNLMELLETIVKNKQADEEVAVHLVTVEDENKADQQRENLDKIKASARSIGLNFSWAFERNTGIHARHIVTDTGWKILLDRGLDIFQPYDMNDALTFANRMQQYRSCKAFEVTFLRIDDE